MNRKLIILLASIFLIEASVTAMTSQAARQKALEEVGFLSTSKPPEAAENSTHWDKICAFLNGLDFDSKNDIKSGEDILGAKEIINAIVEKYKENLPLVVRPTITGPGGVLDRWFRYLISKKNNKGVLELFKFLAILKGKSMAIGFSDLNLEPIYPYIKKELGFTSESIDLVSDVIIRKKAPELEAAVASFLQSCIKTLDKKLASTNIQVYNERVALLKKFFELHKEKSFLKKITIPEQITWVNSEILEPIKGALENVVGTEPKLGMLKTLEKQTQLIQKYLLAGGDKDDKFIGKDKDSLLNRIKNVLLDEKFKGRCNNLDKFLAEKIEEAEKAKKNRPLPKPPLHPLKAKLDLLKTNLSQLKGKLQELVIRLVGLKKNLAPLNNFSQPWWDMLLKNQKNISPENVEGIKIRWNTLKTKSFSIANNFSIESAYEKRTSDAKLYLKKLKQQIVEDDLIFIINANKLENIFTPKDSEIINWIDNIDIN